MNVWLEAMDVCKFRIGDSLCAVPLASVFEAAMMPSLRQLTKATELVEGLVVVRGALVPVLRMSRVLGVPQRPIDMRDHLLVLDVGERMLGVRADEVLGAERLPAGTVGPVPTLMPGLHPLVGVFRRDDDLLLIHDPGRFLDASENAAVDQWLAACEHA